MPNKLRSHNEDKNGGDKGRNNRMIAKATQEIKSGETQINPIVAKSLIVFSMHEINVLKQKNIAKYRIEKSIFSYIVLAEKNRFLAKSDRDRLGLQIPRLAVFD